MQRLLLLALVATCAALPSVFVPKKHVLEWRSFKAAFSKFYESPVEEARRFALFAEKLAFFETHNAAFAAGNVTYTVGVNQFTDMTADEVKKGYLSTFSNTRVKNYVTLPKAPLDAVDWRLKGAVTPVKNQGQCGSCWTFSTTGSVEGAWFIAGNKLVTLSEQQLVDCVTADQGCNGGEVDDAFQYIIKNGGITSEASYKYTARDGKCATAKAKSPVAHITGFKDVPKNNDAQLAAAVAKGPVSVAIEADQTSFQSYTSGIFSGPCGTTLDHAVLVVGYTDAYWIMKNSWGTTWGAEGYMMMARGKGAEGICGINMDASYPIV